MPNDEFTPDAKSFRDFMDWMKKHRVHHWYNGGYARPKAQRLSLMQALHDGVQKQLRVGDAVVYQHNGEERSLRYCGKAVML